MLSKNKPILHTVKEFIDMSINNGASLKYVISKLLPDLFNYTLLELSNGRKFV